MTKPGHVEILDSAFRRDELRDAVMQLRTAHARIHAAHARIEELTNGLLAAKEDHEELIALHLTSIARLEALVAPEDEKP